MSHPAPMKSLILLVDFENVSDVKLKDLPPQSQVRIFVGKSQNNIPFPTTAEAQPLGERLKWIKINGDGKNNLDFHLAYYLGRLTHEFQEAEFVILSKDQGFDSLIDHIGKIHLFRCRRISHLSELAPPPPKPVSPQTAQLDAHPHFERVYSILSKSKAQSRPKNRKTLTPHISAMFQKKLSAKEVKILIDLFFSKKLITATNNVLSYHF